MQVFMVTGLFAGQHNTKLQLLTQLFPSNLEVHFTRALSWPVRKINTDVNSILFGLLCKIDLRGLIHEANKSWTIKVYFRFSLILKCL